MIDSLFVLKNDFGCEGYFKFEGGYKTMLAAASGKICADGQLMWRVDGFQGGFIDGVVKTEAPVSRKPTSLGVFAVADGVAYPLFTVGECALAGYKAGELSEFAGKTAVNASPGDKQDKNGKAEVTKAVDMNIKNTEIREAVHDEALSEAAETTLRGIKNGKAPNTFFDCNAEAFADFLEKNPRVEVMDALIPGSRWAKGDDYILGIIYDENNEPMYLCYGFEFPWSEEPPETLGGYCQWIPVDCSQPRDKGYWVVYVNALTGERVK